MSFKKINEQLIEVLAARGIEAPNAFQTAMIPKIKSGANCYGFGEKGSGKTTTALIVALNKIKFTDEGDNPKVVIFAENKKKVVAIEEMLQEWTYRTDIRTFCIYEEGDLTYQKNTVYPGLDILVATTKRFAQLYFLNGINLGELKMIIVDDAEFLTRGTSHTDIDRISESLKSCQYVLLAEKPDPKFDRLDELFMQRAIKVKA
jgi:superfamily II DNA/RNA helicase